MCYEAEIMVDKKDCDCKSQSFVVLQINIALLSVTNLIISYSNPHEPSHQFHSSMLSLYLTASFISSNTASNDS